MSPLKTASPTDSPAPGPWYLPAGDEVEVFRAAYAARLPVLLRGPTGCGKTRFIEHVAAQVARGAGIKTAPPLVTVACHDDLSSTDLVGRYLLKDHETVWIDGPLTRAARAGSLCYLDEIVEARRDTTVVIHSLTDHRRELWIEKTGERLQAHRDFMLVASYNPQPGAYKALKPSTRQRFVELEFGYPSPEAEAGIIRHETGVDAAVAERLAALAQRLRQLEAHTEISTRSLVHAALLVVQGLEVRRACAVALPVSAAEDASTRQAIADVIDLVLP